jgi:hypothetical protein
MKIRSSPFDTLFRLTPLALALVAACAPGEPARDAPDVSQARERWLAAAGPVTEWPRPIPMRTQPAEDDDLLVTLLGEVETPLAEGLYDPVADRVTLDDGTVMEDYFRETLDIPYYEPLDKSIFPLPPSGWCSWYYYYREVTPEEVLANARWISDNLLDYGARYVQIDDGWQARGGDERSWRDWTGLDPDFQAMGMDSLAGAIRSLGLEAGIWLAPHGQSNREAAQASEAFIWTPDGSSVPSWVGAYLVDPTAPAMEGYLTDLFEKLLRWGYTYFKIDGQTVVLREYARSQDYMAGPVPDGEPDAVAAELFRRTLAPIRETIGPESYLLSSWGTAVPGVGIFDGARTGGDIILGKRGFVTGIRGTQRWAFLHNIAWYSDPDVLLIRPPMTDGLARSWATQIALTGQSLMANDRLPDLPPSRVAMLKKVFPATDIRALDLYQPENTSKSVLDLKVSHLNRSYDVVGLFNYGDEPQLSRHLHWDAIGLDPDQAYHVFDFWSGVYLGAWKGGVFVDVPANDVVVLTLVPASRRPELVSTSRHITQGWVDLKELSSEDSPDGPVLSGRSRVIGGDPYTLTVGFPSGGEGMELVDATAQGSDGAVDVEFESHLAYGTITLNTDRTQEVTWELRFRDADTWVYPPRRPEGLQAAVNDAGNVDLTWRPEYYSIGGYQVEVDGAPVGVAFEPRATLSDLEPGRTYTLAVREVWYDGTIGEETSEITYRVPR